MSLNNPNAEIVANGQRPLAAARCYASLSELEEKILKEANEEFFKQPMSAGHRITLFQARCVIRVWLRNMMPHLLDEA